MPLLRSNGAVRHCADVSDHLSMCVKLLYRCISSAHYGVRLLQQRTQCIQLSFTVELASSQCSPLFVTVLLFSQCEVPAAFEKEMTKAFSQVPYQATKQTMTVVDGDSEHEEPMPW